MSIEEAREFVIGKVLAPAMESPHVSQQVKNITKNQIPWINSCKKVGDVYQYLVKITKGRDESVDEIEEAGLNTYEMILPEFKLHFASQLANITTFKDFKRGQTYSTHDILNVVGQYDTRSGGIQRYKEGEELKAIAIKVTLEGGKYQNEWLIPNQLLKYYMKSISGDFKETYLDNAAIINSGDIPIHAFVRKNAKESFVYKGKYKYLNHFNEGSSKWFQLAKTDFVQMNTMDDIAAELESKVIESSRSPSSNRQKRLSKAPKKPNKRVVTTTVYDRNPDVIAEVLEIANGICGECGNKAPFKRRSNQKPYLEVHHKIRLADGGDDTVENAIALCPNCHREMHFGQPSKK